MSMAEFEKLVVEFGVPKDQTTQVLQALNRCGEVVYLGDKEKNSSLADISVYHSCFIHFFIILLIIIKVFLDCKWLANVMSSVISLKTRIKDGVLNENYLLQVSWNIHIFGLCYLLISYCCDYFWFNIYMATIPHKPPWSIDQIAWEVWNHVPTSNCVVPIQPEDRCNWGNLYSFHHSILIFLSICKIEILTNE